MIFNMGSCMLLCQGLEDLLTLIIDSAIKGNHHGGAWQINYSSDI